MLSSIKDEIAALEAAEAQRQARLQAEARRRVAALAQSSEEAQPLPTPIESLPDGGEAPRGGRGRVGGAARPLRRRRRDRDAVPRRAVPLGRRRPVRLRLLRLHHVRLRAGRRVAAAPRGVAVRNGLARVEERARGGRPRVLQRARPRRHLRRRRLVHPLAPHRATWSRSRASARAGTPAPTSARAASDGLTQPRRLVGAARSPLAGVRRASDARHAVSCQTRARDESDPVVSPGHGRRGPKRRPIAGDAG